ncbi:MAG TPA: DUF3726 domain-containing protein [Roseiarcus sp.]|jgi:hypothetical protein|nr:DUF3726 domain-containing protein [Roseiarcus sp.]
MIVSLNEIETIVLKAARGAGMAWGLAEEAAQAARWLAARCLPFEALFASLLESEAWRSQVRIDGTSLSPRLADGWLCPIQAGAWLSDLGDNLPVRIERVLCPLLLAPFAARRKGQFELAWEGATLLFDVGAVASPPQRLAALHIARTDAAELKPAGVFEARRSLLVPNKGGSSIDVAGWSKLQNFEARDYVPASLGSRLSGAGAALSDND